MRRSIAALLVVPFLSCSVLAQSTAGEARAARALEAARSSPLQLHALLADMPKGADLHMHLSGAVYAESFLDQGAADHLCVDVTAAAFAENAAGAPLHEPCAAPLRPAADVFHDQRLYDALVDSFSMRSFVPTPGVSGHDQFFATFGRFGGVGNGHAGEWLDEVATRAAAQNEQYLEIMQTPGFGPAVALSKQLGWPQNPDDSPRDATPAELAQMRSRLLAAPEFQQNIAAASRQLQQALAARAALEHCGTAQAAPGCRIQIRFLGQVLRAAAAPRVFAQTLLYFELAAHDSNVVGINFVQPEDAYLAMHEYHRQMLMLDYLHGVYPGVHISLHAGELAPGLVPPDGLSFHIREAVELGHAERIGHGVDAMYEHDPHALLHELAARHVMVEINLTSNDVILGVRGKDHPLPAYRAAHVPVSLSTDDEGVSRIDMTHEYTRAAQEFHLGYVDLKNMARTGLEHSFLAGPDLWLQQDVFTRTVAACAAQPIGSAKPTAACAAFLHSSDKATQQWELEHRFQVFEAAQH
ncbi:MAG: adenosine deaminase [Acidobacteriota bacterium]|nr:adenosine deaminase [Acidobacteriota bacterium]